MRPYAQRDLYGLYSLTADPVDFVADLDKIGAQIDAMKGRPMSRLHGYLDWAALAASIAAALLGLRAATIKIRDNMDRFMDDLAAQGRWASWAAVANALAVIALVAIKFYPAP